MENSPTEKTPRGNREHDSPAITSDLPNQLSTEDPPPEWKAGKGEWLIILVLSIVYLMVAIDATILATALQVGSPRILPSRLEDEMDLTAARPLRMSFRVMRRRHSGPAHPSS
jgi:hypothetical protein